MTKPVLHTTDIFKGKVLPPFLKAHPIFNPPAPGEEPNKFRKMFGSIGLSNFRQETDIVKCLTDIKKEGTFVYNALRDITTECNTARELVKISSEATQFLAPLEVRLAKKKKLNEVQQIVHSLSVLAECCDPTIANTFHAVNGVVSTVGSKIELRLSRDIISSDGKLLHKKGRPVFKLFKELYDKCIEHGVTEAQLPTLDSLPSIKNFHTENIPNKKYHIVFSAEGEEGAWDIATMSVRGAKSCQRWDGEYPKCLIGSILSRFVGIIYLTSGAMAEPYGEWGSLGTKMMKRCIVRYAYDRDAEAPCLIMDRMYMNDDQEVIKAFTDALSSRIKYKNPKTGEEEKIPVHYGPLLGAKTKHIYLPNEEILNKISHRERSYQDTALRSKREFDANLLVNNQTEVQKNANRLQSNLTFYIASRYEDIRYNGSSIKIDPSLKKLVDNVGMSIPFSQFSEAITTSLFASFVPAQSHDYFDSKTFYRAHLKSLFTQRKNMAIYSKAKIDDILSAYATSIYKIDVFCDHLLSMMVDFVKKEISITTLNR